MKKQHKFWTLFSTTFGLSACTSGGYVIVSMMRKKFVEKLQWLEEDEMLDLTSIAQSSPGPVAVNASLLVGYRIGGLPGAFITMLGTVLPPLIIMTLVAIFYELVAHNLYIRYLLQGMQAGVAALLCDVTIGLFVNVAKKKSFLYFALMGIAFCISLFTNLSVLFVALFCAAAGICKTMLMKQKAAPKEDA